MSFKGLSRIVKAGGMLVFVICAVFIVLDFKTGETDLFTAINEKIGTIAEIAAIVAAILWLLRLSVKELKKRKFNHVNYVQWTYKFIREHHVFIGWVGFAAALTHGLYFYFQTTDEQENIISGLVAFAAFTLLVSFGVFLDKWSKGKKYAKRKKVHQGLAILFGIALTVHLLL